MGSSLARWILEAQPPNPWDWQPIQDCEYLRRAPVSASPRAHHMQINSLDIAGVGNVFNISVNGILFDEELWITVEDVSVLVEQEQTERGCTDLLVTMMF